MATKAEKNNSLAQVRRKRTTIAAGVFLFPTFILIAVYFIYPIIDTFVISGYKWNGISSARTFIGLQNWVTLIHDKNFWGAFSHNVVIMVFSILLQIPIGMLLATFLDAGGKKFNLFKVIWFLPYLMSSVAIGSISYY